jgi:N-acetylmuramoyl-L-alanine amidase
MKYAFPLWVLLAGLSAGAPAPLGQLKRVSINGHEYVSLAEWAQLNGLQATWVSKQEIRLTNASSRLGFTVNSQKFMFNGVGVFGSIPVALHNGTPYVAPLDLQSTLHPLLWPIRRAGAKTPLICLDPGHGGKDAGNHEGNRTEKEYTLALARELAAQLRKAGYKVCLTRSADTFVELEQRAVIARQRGADLFLSLHFNAAPGTDAHGAEVYCLTPPHTASTNARGEGANTGALAGNAQNDRNVQLAYQLQRSLVARLALEDRGVRRARWAVLRTASMPAVLVESAFMSNLTEASNIYSATWRKRLAEALVEGVKNYQKLMTTAK